jgi:shikimate 5-dehydrogenase
MKLGITGFPLTYTRSPALHRGFMKKAGIKGSYDVLPFDPAQGKKAFFTFLDGLAREGYRGINVTVPLKEWAYEYARRRGGVVRGAHGRCAAIARAANTLVFTRGAARAANTDTGAFWDDVGTWLRGAGIDRFDLLVVGTGGAARGIVAGLRADHEVTRSVGRFAIWGRSPVKAARLRGLVGKRKRRGPAEQLPLLVAWSLPALSSRDVKSVWRLAVRPEMGSEPMLYDLNYGKRAAASVALLPKTRRRDGAIMLKLQAMASFELWRLSERRT